jgi:GAF domain-containing protein
VVEGLGIRSELDVPLAVAGQRRGVLSAASTEPAHWTERDVHFLVAVAGWVGMVTHRAD